MVTYGDPTYGIMISTAKTGTPPNETPSGDIVYLVAPEMGGTESFLQRIIDLAQGTSFGLKDGKRSATLSIQDCYVVKYAESKNTIEFNKIHNWMKAKHREGENPIYFFVKNLTDNEYIKLGMDTSGVAINQLQGYITGYSWSIMAGNVYHIRGLKFKECLE